MDQREVLAAPDQRLMMQSVQGEVRACAVASASLEIIKLARTEPIDLIAMTTHGHRLVADLLHGSTADEVRHQVDVPVLLLKVKK